MKKNYKLYRTMATLTLVTALSAGIATFSGNKQIKEIPYTQADLNNNIIFSTQLQEIMNKEEITFSNPELQSIIEEELEGPITKDNLSTINVLSIVKPLTNNDLSDLKYLTNLHSILIYNNEVNLQDLQYNQDLFAIILNSCKITNSEYLPNSTEQITIENSIYEGTEFIVPYYTKELDTKGSIVNNIRLKNPSYLEKLCLYTDSVLDLNNLRGCTNLKELSLLRISNIKNGEVLRYLTNLESITLDEYASIWLDLDTLNTLPVDKSTKDTLSSQITLLDNMAESIVTDNPSLAPEYKARAIVLYLLDNYDYDFSSVENYEVDSSGVTEYNDLPITTFLESKQGVCINYACLFTALANRVGIDTFQLFNPVHTWNSIKTDEGYICYDLSYLESGAIVKVDDMDSLAIVKDTTPQDMIRNSKGNYLYYYEFDIDKILDDNHIADYTPEEIKNKILNIGYINDNSLVRIIEKHQVKLYKINVFTKSYIILLLLSLILQRLKDRTEYIKQEDIKVLQK